MAKSELEGAIQEVTIEAYQMNDSICYLCGDWGILPSAFCSKVEMGTSCNDHRFTNIPNHVSTL